MNKTKTSAILFILVFSLLLSSCFKTSPNYSPKERKRIAFDEAHKEVHRISDDYKSFRDFLEQSGFEVRSITEGPLTLTKLRAYSVIVLPLPRKSLSREEINSIVKFVEGGGGLLIIGDCGGDQFWGGNINNLSSIFGLTFNPDILRTSEEPVIINRFKQHPITVDVTKIVCLTGSSINIVGDAYGLASASDGVWADRLTGHIGILDPGESYGQNVTVLAVSNFGLGRVVCLGSSTVFINSNLISDHKKLGLNILKWLSSTEPLRVSIENGLVQLKFFDDNLHSSYQLEVWDAEAEKWITAYHDIHFYTTSKEGFNFTWNIGGTSVKTETIDGHQVLIVKYPEMGWRGFKSEVIDIGSNGDEANLYGKGWSESFTFNNRTVRRVLPGREDIHLLLDYPEYAWLLYNLSLIIADAGRGRVDINTLTWEGWKTIESFHTNGTNKWVKISLPLNLSNLFVDSKTNKMRIGIHVEGAPLIIDKVVLSSNASSGSIETIAFLSKDSPIVFFFIRKFGNLQIDGIGVIGDLTTRFTPGKRFALSSLLIDSSSEEKDKAQITQGSCRKVLNLGADKVFSEGPSPEKDMYIYGEGWSEAFELRQRFKAREALAEKTNTFLVVPAPPSLRVLYNLSFSYLDLGVFPVDINLFNGSDWISIGHIKRENTGTWRTATFPVLPSEMYFDPTVGGVKIGIYSYGDSLVISKITAEWETLDENHMAIAFSCGHDRIVNFILVPERNNQIFRHEVDGVNHVTKTIDIFTPLSTMSRKEKTLPVAAIGSYMLDTSTFLMEAEDSIAEGWRPKPVEFSTSLTPSSLAVARINASSMNLKFIVSHSGTYSIFVKYFDFVEDSSSKKVIISVNSRKVGVIRYEGTGKFQVWRREVNLPAGINTVTLTPVSKTPTSEIAFIDYVLVAPRVWEEQAASELRSIKDNLGDDDAY